MAPISCCRHRFPPVVMTSSLVVPHWDLDEIPVIAAGFSMLSRIRRHRGTARCNRSRRRRCGTGCSQINRLAPGWRTPLGAGPRALAAAEALRTAASDGGKATARWALTLDSRQQHYERTAGLPLRPCTTRSGSTTAALAWLLLPRRRQAVMFP